MISLKLDGVKKGFGERCIIQDATASFAEGAAHLLSGRNGIGKTVLLEIMGGLSAPTCGTVQLDGRDVTRKHPATCRRIVMAQAESSFLDSLTVEAAVRLFMALRNLPAKKSLFIDFDPFSLAPWAKTEFRRLSLGWRKRVILHMSFVADADVTILDEPTVGLDTVGVSILGALIKERACHQLVLLTCHDPAPLGLKDVHEHLLKSSGKDEGSVLVTYH